MVFYGFYLGTLPQKEAERDLPVPLHFQEQTTAASFREGSSTATCFSLAADVTVEFT